jgi:cytochrome c-type biogenesis protein CcmF
MFPTISEAIDGSRVSVGPEFFNKWMTPFGLALLFLAGAAPLLAWRKTTRERLWNQFMFPTVFAAVTVVALLIFFPQTKELSPLFADQLELPISLVNFALCAFVVGSIGQEFWRGAAVRKKQTGSDAMTSLIGLVLSKRRKYGGYIVHLAVAVMFFGFAGKAYEHMIDRTVERPGLFNAQNGVGESSFQFTVPRTKPDGTPYQDPEFVGPFTTSRYSFTYEKLFHTSDDHKDAVTAQVGIYDNGERVGTVYPAKWDYHKSDDQMTSEVAIKVRIAEDVYLVLTGFDLESKQANFRVYVNPLILWVWIGFLLLGLGTLICLIPERAANIGWKPKTKLGRAADVSIVVGIVLAIMLGLGSQAYAQPPGGGEHVPAGMGMGQSGAGWAAMNRPRHGTEEKAMKELICPCGCARQDIHGCDCKTAADLRAKVMGIIDGFDMSTEAGREKGYEAVLADFVKAYGESVLATPKSKFPWLLPALAAVGGLGLLLVIARRWMRRNAAESAAAGATAAAATATPTAADEKYVDQLEDELAETD